MGFLRWVGTALGIVLVAAVLVGVLARFSDGPIGPFPGGPFRSGEFVTDPDPDLSFLRHVTEVELQLLDPERSRTVWVIYLDGIVYIPCGFLQLPLWKQWPHEAAEDGRALLRVQGRIYPVQATKVTDPESYADVAERAAQKYDFGGAEPDPESVWFFRLDPRPVPED